jgi:3-oxoadipate enol-lactonase
VEHIVNGLHVEEAGEGAPVVLVHAGIADSRMWDPQWEAWAGRYRLVRYDQRGFGRSTIEAGAYSHGADLLAVLDALGLERAILVGSSLGGRIALEVALAQPERVTALVLVDAAIPGVDWSQEVRGCGAAEDAAHEAGDLDAATDLNVRFWVDGPGRTPDAVAPALREQVRTMQRRAFELQAGLDDDEEPLVEDLGGRLGELRGPALVLVGADDVADFHAIADLLAAAVPGAERATVTGAAHLPSAERPEAFAALVEPFLERYAR